MDFHNLTSFPHQVFQTIDLNGTVHWVCIMKVGCSMDDTSTWDGNENIELVDTIDSKEGNSRILKPADIVPFKPNGELLMLNAIASSVVSRQSWKVGIRTEGIAVEFTVCGRRFWRKNLITGWSLSEPEATNEVALSYENAYGGSQNGVVYHANPVGKGFCIDPSSNKAEAPQFFLENEFFNDPFGNFELVGVEPISPSWSIRRLSAGTFDRDWSVSRKPLLPKDFSFDFYNCAPKCMRKHGYFRGDEEITCYGMEANRQQSFKMPGYLQPCLVMRVEQMQYAIAKLNLDTVLLDWKSRRISAVYRACAMIPPAVKRVDILSEVPQEFLKHAA